MLLEENGFSEERKFSLSSKMSEKVKIVRCNDSELLKDLDLYEIQTKFVDK